MPSFLNIDPTHPNMDMVGLYTCQLRFPAEDIPKAKAAAVPKAAQWFNFKVLCLLFSKFV